MSANPNVLASAEIPFDRNLTVLRAEAALGWGISATVTLRIMLEKSDLDYPECMTIIDLHEGPRDQIIALFNAIRASWKSTGDRARLILMR